MVSDIQAILDEMYNTEVKSPKDKYFLSQSFKKRLYRAYKDDDPERDDTDIGDEIEEYMRDWSDWAEETWGDPSWLE